MSLTQAQIKHLEKLTALRTSSKPLSIDSIVTSFDSLKSVDTKSIAKTTRSGKTELLLRQDIVSSVDIMRGESLLQASKQRVIGRQIALSGIMHTDE